MTRLFKAFFFKIRKDLTFRITLIIGAVFAVFTCLLFLIPDESGVSGCTGQNMLLNTLSPITNFGIAIPVNLVSFTCLEFTQGTIRNKIIAGNSKFKIFASLFLTGIFFVLALVFVYAGICTIFGTIIGGFNLEKPATVGLIAVARVTVPFIIQTIIIYICMFIFLTALGIFFATLFRNIGPCIPIMISFVFLTFLLVFFSKLYAGDNETLETVLKIFVPTYGTMGASYQGGEAYYDAGTFFACVGCNLVYTALLFTGGALIFTKRDVK